jgi:hypothetical protein
MLMEKETLKPKVKEKEKRLQKHSGKLKQTEKGKRLSKHWETKMPKHWRLGRGMPKVIGIQMRKRLG